MSIRVSLVEDKEGRVPPSIVMDEKGKQFEITWGGNLDLYFVASQSEQHGKDSIETIEFDIKKEDSYLYQVLEELLYEISTFRILEDKPDKRLKRQVLYTKLYDPKTGSIMWESDEGYNIVQIQKEGEVFKITFYATDLPENNFQFFRMKNRIAIRFRTSGSNYGYCYSPFTRMYQKLRKYYEEKEG